MKKIMKKALSLMLVLALTIVPMSVMAAEGDAVTDSLEWCYGNTVTVGAGQTKYFEFSGAAGNFDFVVEGSGDFSVATCTVDDYNGYYIGETKDATDGKVETTIAIGPYGAGAFSITNNTSAEAEYEFSVVYPEGTQANPKAVTLSVGGTAKVTLSAGAQYYVSATLPEMNKEFQLTITGNTGFGYSNGYGMPASDTNGKYISTVSASMWTGGTASFVLFNNTDSEQTYTLALDNMPLGSASNPDALKMGYTTKRELSGAEYCYTWTAPEAGKVVLEIISSKCEDGWTYKFENADSWVSYHRSTGWDEADQYMKELNVNEGEVVNLAVSVPGATPYDFSEGTVVFSISFVPGESVENPDGDEGTEDDDIINIEGGDNYYGSEERLVNGNNVVSTEKDYTVFEFKPTETGIYTFETIDESKLAIVSSNGMWVTVTPSEETVTETEINWTCTSVGQSILIAVNDADDDGNVNVLIYKENLEVDDLDVKEYENKTTPKKFTFTGDADKLLDSPVDTFDDVADKAVLGDDGYYHLNAADGPVLFVNLSDSMTSLVAAREPGQLNAMNYDENGDLVSKTDFNSAFDEYLACADVTSIDGATLYPLTEDLKTIFQRVGTDKNWYGKAGWIGGELDDAWMFACYYEEGLTSLGSATTGGTGSSTSTGSSAQAGAPSTSTQTGDATSVVLWVAVMMLGLATVVVVMRKRAR